MDDITVTGIVLSAMPYKEKDKLIHIFTVELGVVTGILKGVKSPKAKLKFAGQAFSFGTFELALGHDFYVVKGMELIDSFYDLTLDYEKFKYANMMLEICKIILKPNIISESLFISLMKTLNNITYSDIDYKICVIKFLCTTLQIIGYKLNFDTCDNCNMKFIGDIKFDYDSGTFRCFNCSGGILISKQNFVSLKIINDSSYDKLSSIKLKSNTVNEILKMLVINMEHRLNCKIKSVNQDDL